MRIKLRYCGIILLFLFIFPVGLQAQGTWVWNWRTHSELRWFTLETENFLIHYHQGLDSIATDASNVAESIWPTLLEQLDVSDNFEKVHITLTAEDEITNGYVLPSNQVFIWVNQNNAAGHFGGSEKWLEMVIAHELQHVVLINALRTWIGIWNYAAVPFWFIEGTAEYFTEKWRVGRSDATLKLYTYNNRLHRLDPHDEGFAKVLYLAEQYGDSTLQKIVHWRHPVFGYYNFRQAFRDAVYLTPEQFHEDWRKSMSTYYYSYRGQKESPNELGELIPAPGMAFIANLAYSPDSSAVVYVGRKAGKRYKGLYLRSTDSSSLTELHAGQFYGQPDWSPDSRYIAIGEYHRGMHGSLIYDIREIDTKTGEKHWITDNQRAKFSVYSVNGKNLYFTAHPGFTTDIFEVERKSGTIRKITSFKNDTEVKYLAISPDGERLSFMIQDSSGAVDIAVIDTSGENLVRLTNDDQEDLYPVWTQDNQRIIFTSYRNSTPNLYSVYIDSPGVYHQVTDIYSGIYSLNRMPGSVDILTRTISDADSSQIVLVNPSRRIQDSDLVLKSRYEKWRTQTPVTETTAYQSKCRNLGKKDNRPYAFWRSPGHLASLVLPTPNGISGFTAWNDPLGKQTVILGGEIPYNPVKNKFFNAIYFAHNIAVFEPFISYGGVKNLSFYWRPVSNGFLRERRDGFFVSATIPYNSGNSLYANHWFHAKFEAYNRYSTLTKTTDQDEIATENGRTGNFSIDYYFLRRKPENQTSFLPTNGYGFSLKLDFADASLFGGDTYQRQGVEAFRNTAVFRNLIFYIRGVAAQIHGSYAPQDSLGFYDKWSIYPIGRTPFMLGLHSFFDTDENLALRGYNDSFSTESLVMLTVELRYLLASSLPVQVAFFNLGGMSVAPYIDVGMSKLKRISTAGIEIRNEVNFGSYSAFHIGYGFGNTIRNWREHLKPHWFLRMALINSF